MGIEIERKFLVNKQKWEQVPKPAGEKLRQGYMLNNKDKTIRLRITPVTAYLTFKSGTRGISRNEYEYEIPIDDASELYEQFVITGLEKTRYCVSFEDKLWEVDVFFGDNDGLIIAEIELDAEDELFELPPWVTEEVTGQEKYYNSSLSVRPYKGW
jgi:adenylate cyclase